jgi:hypothetical protein
VWIVPEKQRAETKGGVPALLFAPNVRASESCPIKRCVNREPWQQEVKTTEPLLLRGPSRRAEVP